MAKNVDRNSSKLESEKSLLRMGPNGFYPFPRNRFPDEKIRNSEP
jgi:hypothetical protein